MFSFHKKKRSPQELVHALLESEQHATEHKHEEHKPDDKTWDRVVDDLCKLLMQMKVTLYGDSETGEPVPEVIDALVAEVLNTGVLEPMVGNLDVCEFEARKDTALIFSALIRRQPTMVEHVRLHPIILEMLLRGYEAPEIALTSGTMLRECIRYEPLAAFLLETRPLFSRFFQYVELANFDLASDAFASFKELLTRHKGLVADFLQRNFDDAFGLYGALLNSQNYVTRRQSIKLLGELLLDRANFNVMTRYIADVNHLKVMMNLLRDKSRNIQFESFHVFKVFVANPQKPPAVVEILAKNKEKLIAFLTNFHTDKEDEQFNEEKQLLITEIQRLQVAEHEP